MSGQPDPTADAAPATAPPAPAGRSRCRPSVAAAPTGDTAAAAVGDGMLKLMLILLAFFVVLHNRSEVSTVKAAPVLDSLALRFAAAPVDGPRASLWQDDGTTDPATDLRRRVVASLPVQARAQAAPGAIVAFELADDLLFEPGAASIRRERRVLLGRLATASAAAGPSLPAVLEVTAAWPAGDAGPAAARLTALAAILLELGLPPERLAIGFAAQPAAVWRFAVVGLPAHDA